MARYFAKPANRVRADDEWEYCSPLMTNITVNDHEPVDTGLFDAAGNRIMRAPNPVGFGRDDEW
jgi:hypothetical protein